MGQKHERILSRQNALAAFTLLELMTCIVIILILAALLMPGFGKLREKARAVQCTSNLKNLFIAANGYVQDNQHWPQIRGMDVASEPFAKAWLAALRPYSVDKQNWLCPTVKSETHYTEASDFKLDYIPTPFGSNPINPFLWPNHPWFSERGAVHGRGNLIILTNGSVKALYEITGGEQQAPE